jgi:hypothetical protein
LQTCSMTPASDALMTPVGPPDCPTTAFALGGLAIAFSKTYC